MENFGTLEEGNQFVVFHHYRIPAIETFISKKWIRIGLTFILALIVAYFTWEGIYYGATITAQNSKIIADEQCFLLYWLCYKNISTDPINFGTKYEEKLAKLTFFEKFAYHSKARNEHYLFDPMVVLAFLYFFLPLFVFFNWIFVCAFKKNQELLDVTLYLTFYVFFLFVILLFKSNSASDTDCTSQFLNL